MVDLKIAPISATGWRGAAKPAAFGEMIEWRKAELQDGVYDRFALIRADGSEVIGEIAPVPVRFDDEAHSLRLKLG